MSMYDDFNASLPNRKNVLKPGSIHSDLHYRFEQKTFTKGDVPDHALTSKRTVQRSIKPDILCLNKKSWDISSQSVGPRARFPDPSVKRAISIGQSIPPIHNYRAEVLPKANVVPAEPSGTKFTPPSVYSKTETEILNLSAINTRRTEMPVHPDLDGKEQWNTSTTMNNIERNKLAKTILDTAKGNAVKSKKKMIANYVDPVTRQKNRMDKQRSEKKAARATTEADNSQGGSQGPQQYNTVRDRRYKMYEHSGVWEYNPQMKCNMWSDTGSTEYDSRGDTEIVVNPDAWNYSSFGR